MKSFTFALMFVLISVAGVCAAEFEYAYETNISDELTGTMEFEAVSDSIPWYFGPINLTMQGSSSVVLGYKSNEQSIRISQCCRALTYRGEVITAADFELQRFDFDGFTFKDLPMGGWSNPPRQAVDSYQELDPLGYGYGLDIALHRNRNSGAYVLGSWFYQFRQGSGQISNFLALSGPDSWARFPMGEVSCELQTQITSLELGVEKHWNRYFAGYRSAASRGDFTFRSQGMLGCESFQTRMSVTGEGSLCSKSDGWYCGVKVNLDKHLAFSFTKSSDNGVRGCFSFRF